MTRGVELQRFWRRSRARACERLAQRLLDQHWGYAPEDGMPVGEEARVWKRIVELTTQPNVIVRGAATVTDPRLRRRGPKGRLVLFRRHAVVLTRERGH